MSTTFWASWWTKQVDIVQNNGRFMHQFWVSGQRLSDDAESVCSLMTGVSAKDVEQYVKAFFTDADMRFCEVKPAGWQPPADRFPR